MNNLIATEITGQNTFQTPIEIVLGVDDQGRTTAKKLYEFLELNKSNYSKWTDRNIKNNEYAEVNVDYIPFVLNDECGGQATIDYKITATFAKKLAMGTHNFKGEAAKQYFIKVENELKNIAININELSPELQMFNKLFTTLANQQLEQKRLQVAISETKGEVQAIRDTVTISVQDNWRDETNKLISRICKSINDYKTPKNDIYKALEQRAACDLKRRLENMRGRMALDGASKTKINDLCYLDVISEDKKLKEIYIQIVKEMVIKYKIA